MSGFIQGTYVVMEGGTAKGRGEWRQGRLTRAGTPPIPGGGNREFRCLHSR